jgi:hypothetical protein
LFVVRKKEDRVVCLEDRAKPVTVNELQSWLGVANYYRKFIENYADLAKPLYDLMGLKNVPKNCRKRNGAVDGKKVIITWTNEAEVNFEKLKKILCSDLVLALPNFEKQMSISTDASDCGYGGVLEQEFDGVKRPIAYFSKSYTSTQKNYSTPEKELLAMVMTIEYFHQYIYGRHFTVHTDHQPLTWIKNKTNTHQRLERWLLRLSNYDFDIQYRPGAENIVADNFSRIPNEDEFESSENDYHDNLVAAIVSNDNSESTSASESDSNANVIAQNPNSTLQNEFESLRDEQLKDADIQWAKTLIKTNGDNKPKIHIFENITRKIFYKQYHNLTIIEGLLYRNSEDRNGFKITQFVLPKQIVQTVVKQIHSSIFNAHLGKSKTTHKITDRFYRPFLKDEIKECIKCCEICQKTKTTQPQRLAEMLYLTPCKPNQLITTDIAGPFKKTVRGNTYLQVVIDHFTKFVEFYPLKNTQSNSLADNIVNEWCCTYGIPESILSDGGTNYQSKLLDLVYEYLDIRRLKTTPFHPQCDGQSERTVQTLKNMIKAHVDCDQMTWDLNLKKFAFAYNTAVHMATRQTPFEMMFGRRPRIPIDIIIPNVEHLERAPILEQYKITNELGEITVLEDVNNVCEANLPAVASNYLRELKEKLAESYRVAELNRNITMEKAKINFDRQIKKSNYNVGDLVLCDHPKLKKGLSQGIAHKYYGPFVVVGKNDNGCDYFIRLASNPRAHIKQIHNNRLKMFFNTGVNLTEIKQEPTEAAPAKRAYRKNPQNPRWNLVKPGEITVSSDESSLSSADSAQNIQLNYDSDESSSSDCPTAPKLVKKTTRRRGQNKSQKLDATLRKSSRVSKPPERFTFKN